MKPRTLFTADLLYDTYKNQMPGVTKEEFLEYAYKEQPKKQTGRKIGYKKPKSLAWRQKMYAESFITKFENFSKGQYKIKIREIIGKIFWYEYHCDESPGSADAELWYRSHQQVEVTDKSYSDPGEPEQYNIKFLEDGFEGVAFDDELLNSTEEFYRPDPPEKY